MRELENLIERLGVMGGYKNITLKELPPEIKGDLGDEQPAQGGKIPARGGGKSQAPEKTQSLWDAEKNMIIEALKASRGNRAAAARRLGIPRHVLLYRLKKYNIKVTK